MSATAWAEASGDVAVDIYRSARRPAELNTGL
jgi:hypothetical protein